MKSAKIEIKNKNEKIQKEYQPRLLDLKLLEGDLNEVIETNKYFDFYMHRVGHYLGLDVHDVGGKNEIVNQTTGILIEKNFKPIQLAKIVDDFSSQNKKYSYI